MAVNEVYFSHAEMKNILEHYGKIIRDKGSGYKEKIPYNSYRRLYGSHKGITVVEDIYGVLWYHDAEADAYDESHYAYDYYSDKLIHFQDTETSLIMATTSDSDFHRFFRNNYLLPHCDYHLPYKKKEYDMRNLNCSVNSNYYNGSSNYSAEPLYTWTTQSHWNSNKSTISVDTMDLNKALAEFNEAVELTTDSTRGIGNEINKLNNKNEKEKDSMKGLNFDFGPCTNDNVRMSMYGIAVKNQSGEWVSYNPATAQIVNVDIFNFDGRKYMFKMPVAIKEVTVGDVIIHQKKPMFVLEVCDDESGVIAVDVVAGEEKKILCTTNMFNFNFVTKIVSMFSAFAAAPTPDAPFGNFLPFMMMNEDSKDFDPMMMFMMMQNGNMGEMFNNPMMMYFLCKDSGNDLMLPFMMMMNQTQTSKNKHNK